MTNPSCWSCRCNLSRCNMGSHTQCVTEATHLRESDGAPQVQSGGLGVTEAALDVFNNFVHQLVANVVPTSEAALNVPPSNPQPRRSKRFATRQEGEATPPLTLPAPPQLAVRPKGMRVV